MKPSRRILFVVASCFLLLAFPDRSLLPIRNGTLLAFCGRGSPSAENVDLDVWALKEENASLRAQVEQLRSALGVAGGNPLQPALATALPAKIVYRGPSSWNSSLWVGVGERDNRGRAESVVEKGSPVVRGRALVGVVDYVGKSRSRVALLTDPQLHPAVEAHRGDRAAYAYLALLDVVEAALSGEEDLQESILMLKNHFGKTQADSLTCAKGELSGAQHPLWRSHDSALRGIGFEGKGGAKPGDLLVTTGLDGVFPEGLEVAHVVEVTKAHPGKPSYELKAVPVAGAFDRAEVLFILPSQRQSQYRSGISSQP